MRNTRVPCSVASHARSLCAMAGEQLSAAEVMATEMASEELRKQLESGATATVLLRAAG